jgi:hypothetical protein
VEKSKRMRIDIDKLPMKRLHAINEIGNEQFPHALSSLPLFFLLTRLTMSSFPLLCGSSYPFWCLCLIFFLIFRDKSNEEQRLSAIHHIDFSLVVEKEKKEKEKENENEK